MQSIIIKKSHFYKKHHHSVFIHFELILFSCIYIYINIYILPHLRILYGWKNNIHSYLVSYRFMSELYSPFYREIFLTKHISSFHSSVCQTYYLYTCIQDGSFDSWRVYYWLFYNEWMMNSPEMMDNDNFISFSHLSESKFRNITHKMSKRYFNLILVLNEIMLCILMCLFSFLLRILFCCLLFCFECIFCLLFYYNVPLKIKYK